MCTEKRGSPVTPLFTSAPTLIGCHKFNSHQHSEHPPHPTPPPGQLVSQQFYSWGSDRLALVAEPAWCVLFSVSPVLANAQPLRWWCARDWSEQCNQAPGQHFWRRECFLFCIHLSRVFTHEDNRQLFESFSFVLFGAGWRLDGASPSVSTNSFPLAVSFPRFPSHRLCLFKMVSSTGLNTSPPAPAVCDVLALFAHTGR